MTRTQIGYVCGRGHYCFYADPEENGACGGKAVGEIYITNAEDFEPGLLDECERQLADVISTWREAP